MPLFKSKDKRALSPREARAAHRRALKARSRIHPKSLRRAIKGGRKLPLSLCESLGG